MRQKNIYMNQSGDQIMLIDVQKYFSYDEWKIIEEKAAAEEIILFCIENREVFETQNKIIIDNDGCRVV